MRGLVWFVIGFWAGAAVVTWARRVSEKVGTISDKPETVNQVVSGVETMIGSLEKRRPLRRRAELWERQVGDILDESG